MGYELPPVLIDPTTLGDQPDPFPLRNGGQAFGPYPFGGAQYIFLSQYAVGFPPGSATVFKSLDDGATWSFVVASQVGTFSFATAFDGVQTVRAAFGGLANGADMFLQDFDLLTEAWGLPFGTGAIQATNVWAIVFLANGDNLVVFTPSRSVLPEPTYRAALWSSGWSAEIDVGANALSGFGKDANQASFSYVMDPTNLIMHAFFAWQNAGLLPGVCYQQIDGASLTLGQFDTFIGVDMSPNGLGAPAIHGTNLVVPYSNSGGGALQAVQGVMIGTPFASPVWGVPVIPVDPGYPLDPDLVGGYNGQLTEFAGVLYLMYVVKSIGGAFLFDRLRMLQTSNVNPAIGWSGTTVFNGATDGGPGWVRGQLKSPWIGEPLHNGGLSIAVTSMDPVSLTVTMRFWMRFSAAGGALTLADSPPAGKVGVPYTHCFIASGGTPPYVGYAVTAGALPPGLVLDPVTGCISGTPTAVSPAGVPFTFDVTVTDSVAATASVSASISIALNIIIQLIGWKLYPNPPCDTLPSQVPEPPSVKRAV